MYTKLAFESSSVHKRSAKRVSRFYESNESVNDSESKSNPQNKRKCISLCNFNLSRIKFTFAIDPPWDGRHQPGASLL